MNRKGEKTFAGSTATSKNSTSSSIKNENGNSQQSSVKCPPKTLDIPNVPSSKKTIFGNGHGGGKGDRRSNNAPNLNKLSNSPRRSENNSKERQKYHRQQQLQQQQNHQRQQEQRQPAQKTSPVSTLSTSTSSSSSSSSPGILPSHQFAIICREVAQIRDEHMAIRKTLKEKEGELVKAKVLMKNVADERDFLQRKVSELERILKHSPEMYSHVATYLSSSSNSGPITSPQAHTMSAATTTLSNSGFQNSHQHHSPTSVTFSTPSTATNITATNKNQPSHQTQEHSKLIKCDSSNASLKSNLFQQPNQKLTSTTTQERTVAEPSNKCFNGNESNSKLVPLSTTDKIVLESKGKEMQRMVSDPVSRTSSATTSPSSPHANINSQESRHQPNNKNKTVLESQQHQQQPESNRNTPLHKSKSICNDQHQYGQVPLSTPPVTYLELRNGNNRNENGNEVVRPMTNGNNNNNHLKNVYCGRRGNVNGDHGCYEKQPHQSTVEQSGITGLELMLLAPDCGTKVVEHLVHPLAIESSVREIQHTLVLKGAPLSTDRLREVEIEIDRLNSRASHLRSQNDVLSLNLEDAKGQAERLSVLCGKLESNSVALQLALKYSDQMTDAYEILTSLLETEVAQIFASLHSQGLLHLICSSASNTITSTNNCSASVFAVASHTSSGNNNNSSGNSPSEPIAPTAQILSPNIAAKFNRSSCNEKDKTNSELMVGENINAAAEKNNLENGHLSGCKKGNDTASEGKNMTEIVPFQQHANEASQNTTNSPRSPLQSPSSWKTASLMEKAKQNRVAAEKAAHFILNQFSSTKVTAIKGNQSTENNNFMSYPIFNHQYLPHNHSESTTGSVIISSSTSAASDLSNISGESGEQKLTEEQFPEETAPQTQELHHSKHQVDQIKQLSPQHHPQPSTIITVEEESGKSTPNDAQIISTVNKGTGNVSVSTDMLMMMTTSTTTNSSSSTTSSSSTFRAPLSPSFPINGNEQGEGCTSMIPSLLPFLQASNQSYQSKSKTPSIESSIRSLISTLKRERDAVKQTVIMELESESLESLTPSPKPSSPYYSSNNNNGSNSTTPTATSPWSAYGNLEMAILMQELMGMREQRADLRCQLFLLEKEKDSLLLRLKNHETQEDVYKAKINYLKSEIMDYKSSLSSSQLGFDTYNHQDNRNRNDIMNTPQHHQNINGNNRNLETALINNNNNNQNVNWEREALLKMRIHELATTLEKVTVNSDVRQKENEAMINELNRANGILMDTLAAAKTKYQNRIKKMEDQILYISERHVAQMKLFAKKLPS